MGKQVCEVPLVIPAFEMLHQSKRLRGPQRQGSGQIMSTTQPIVHIVDDDSDSALGVKLILEHAGLEGLIYGSGEEFLDRFVDAPEGVRSLLLDIRMPGLSGLGVLHELSARRIQIPTLVFSSYMEVPLVVEAMKLGAVDALEKPVNGQVLLERVQTALDLDAAQAPRRVCAAAFRARKQLLSDRENQVIDLLLQGQNAKQIAARLEINSKTVMKYRTQVLEKMKVGNIVELIRTQGEDSSRH